MLGKLVQILTAPKLSLHAKNVNIRCFAYDYLDISREA